MKRVFKNVVAQFIGLSCLMNQATREILEVKIIRTAWSQSSFESAAKLNGLMKERRFPHWKAI